MTPTQIDDRAQAVYWRAAAREDRKKAAYWRRSALGTWAVNLVLSGVVLWLLWGAR